MAVFSIRSLSSLRCSSFERAMRCSVSEIEGPNVGMEMTK